MNKIFAIGDSHCIFYYDSLNIENLWVGWGGMPVTIYQLINNGLPLYNIVDRLPPGDNSHINIKENDIVLFCYGWNDVQKNIYKYAENNYETEIDTLVLSYINIIKKYSDGTLYKIKPIINCVYPIPISNNDTIFGSEDDRIKYTIYINKKLKATCLENNIPFFDIYDILSDNNKISVNVVDPDGTHVDRKNAKLRDIIETKLMTICQTIEKVEH